MRRRWRAWKFTLNYSTRGKLKQFVHQHHENQDSRWPSNQLLRKRKFVRYSLQSFKRMAIAINWILTLPNLRIIIGPKLSVLRTKQATEREKKITGPIRKSIWGLIPRKKFPMDAEKRFFAKGYRKVKGTDYQESFALVVRYDSLWVQSQPITRLRTHSIGRDNRISLLRMMEKSTEKYTFHSRKATSPLDVKTKNAD